MKLETSKNQSIFIIIFVIVLSSTLTFYYMNRNKKVEPKKETAEEVEKIEEIKLTASEKIVWNLFLEEAKNTNYIIESNLDTIELVSIEDYGKYTKSKPDLRYEQINFKYTCKDKTTDCIKANKVEAKDYYTQLVTINLKDKTYIKIGGLSFGMNEQLIDVNEPFTYYDLEN